MSDGMCMDRHELSSGFSGKDLVVICSSTGTFAGVAQPHRLSSMCRHILHAIRLRPALIRSDLSRELRNRKSRDLRRPRSLIV